MNGSRHNNKAFSTESTPKESKITTTETTSIPEDTTKLATEYQANITTFKLSDYQDSIDFFEENDINVTVGDIHNYNEAVEQAKIVWRDEMKYDAYEGRDIKIYYNEEADCWLAKLATNWDYFHEQMKEGIYVLSCDPCVIIRSDGKVLAYWTE